MGSKEKKVNMNKPVVNEEKKPRRILGKSRKSKNIAQSFGYAFEGLGYALRTVNNLRIHLLFTLLVVFGGMFFKISRMEYLVCLIFVALVISLELVNTAIEEVVDLCSPEINQLAKRSKDVAAGAVLFSAVIAFVVGCVIFVPKILLFLKGAL